VSREVSIVVVSKRVVIALT